MKRFLLLVKKDLRMMRWVIWIAVTIIAVSGILSYLTEEISVVLGFASVTFLYFPPLYMVKSLSKDWRQGLLHQMPQNGQQLLLAKLVAELLSLLLLALFTAAGVFLAGILVGASYAVEDQSVFFALCLLFTPLALGYSLYGGIVGGAAVLLARCAENIFPKGHNWIGFLGALVPVLLISGFTNTQVFNRVFGFLPSFVYDVEGVREVYFMGNILFSGAVLCIVFFLSAWLLDKKVEV